ncbi:MAG: extracellular solute-binding protein [Lachnospiraceae bacterium]|nr:extracellular solute-binding protein [Lachnospiraceae bacterium]
MKFRKATALLLASTMGAALAAGTALAAEGDNSVVIYSPNEDYLIEFYLEKLNEQFPDYDISIEYESTGKMAAKLQAEGDSTSCDIIMGMSYGYLESLKEGLASIDFIDTSVYMPELLEENNRYIPWDRFSGATIVNTAILEEKGLPAPTSYEDLLDPQYEGLIEMPNPTASSTGYLYLKSLVNAWGEEEAFDYFAQLDNNILKYTDSGSGPIHDLEAGECAIGLSLTFNAIEAKNAGAPLDVIFFEEGAPYSPTGCAIVAGKEADPVVKEVFEYIYSGIQDEYLATYLPEQVKIDQQTEIENFPTDIPYADMSGDTPDVKAALLDQWEF